MDDATISTLIAAITEVGWRSMTVPGVVQALRERHPELLAAFDFA